MEAIYKTFDVALELKQTSTNAPFYVIEGDNGNKIRITVTDGGSAVDLTDCRVIAVFSKSNGTSMQDSAEAGGGVTIGGTYNNEVTVALRPASIAPGQVECELQIYSDENKTTLITTAKFNFECQRAIFNENTAMATNEYPLLVSLISVCNGIVAAEGLRVTAEASRVSAEGERAAAEAARETAEGERVEAEEAREAAETARVSAESSRVATEQGRETAEQSRVTSEAVRASAETERETAESERETAETARTSAETSRVTAEQGRVSAENTRVSQEQERQAEILKIAGMTVEVTTLAAGAQATAELVESGDHKVLKLGIPKGRDGSGTGDMEKSTYDTDNSGVVDNAERLEGHDASYFSQATHRHDGIYQPKGSYAAPSQGKAAALSASAWAGAAAPFTQAVTVQEVTASSNIIVTPAPASLEAYGAAQVRCTAQAANSLTFACSKVPESNLTVNILIVG